MILKKTILFLIPITSIFSDQNTQHAPPSGNFGAGTAQSPNSFVGPEGMKWVMFKDGQGNTWAANSFGQFKMIQQPSSGYNTQTMPQQTQQVGIQPPNPAMEQQQNFNTGATPYFNGYPSQNGNLPQMQISTYGQSGIVPQGFNVQTSPYQGSPSLSYPNQPTFTENIPRSGQPYMPSSYGVNMSQQNIGVPFTSPSSLPSGYGPGMIPVQQ